MNPLAGFARPVVPAAGEGTFGVRYDDYGLGC